MPQTPSMQELFATTYLSGGNASYVESLFESYLKDPSSVSDEWQRAFEKLPKVNGDGDVSHADIRAHFAQIAKQRRVGVSSDVEGLRRQHFVDALIDAYRIHGHLQAKIDPLGRERPKVADLTLSFHGLSPADLEIEFFANNFMSTEKAKLKDILERLEKLYCGSIGAEFMYVTDPKEREWLISRFEKGSANYQFDAEKKKKILKQLVAADTLEKYLGNKYVGQKRFSLEGGDSLIPLVKFIIDRASYESVEEVVIGMAHRGRLNVLINVLGQASAELFQEFEGTKDYGLSSGDVKYHLGYSSDIETSAGKSVHQSLAFNPSHLEVISGVVMGSVRARLERHKDYKGKEALAILVHGDAAISGQGIVMETFNMSNTPAYGIGGSIHIVVNNQVGFTTSNPHDARSSVYCTDIAKMISAPVFHVNANDPEAVVFLAELATDYRNTFHKDIIIDLVCFRLHGHNEADEPRATQPMMYEKISHISATQKIYAKQLVKEGVCDEGYASELIDSYRGDLDQGKSMVKTIRDAGHHLAGLWQPYLGKEWDAPFDTAVTKKKVVSLGEKLDKVAAEVNCQRQVGMVMKHRASMTKGETPCDWGYAEVMAYATLLDQGYSIRMSGQDCQRGTFAHRHAVLHDQESGELVTPLAHINPDKTRFRIYDSLLSEEGVLGFEFGYAKTTPDELVIWEAQFGDFANGAQVIIDQFLSSSWQKWERLCGLVLLLPHGYEGQGPEHSSARLERYLQLCAQHNIQVCVPSTPAQVYHMLRRQILRPYRKPLVVMTPKSLLRHKLAVSSLDELANGHFQLLIPEQDKKVTVNKVRKVILCSGKVYYDLLEYRTKNEIKDVAIIRVEQLYPFPYEELREELARYKKAAEVVWCQEEPKNQGAWFISRDRLTDCLAHNKQTLHYAGRPASAAPAVGYPKLHQQQQAELVQAAFA